MLVIPTYNERNNIRSLVERIRRAVPALPIFFVDDNSPDGTAEEIRALQTTDANIHLLVRESKLGLGSAYREAFLQLLERPEIEYMIAFDADLSHPPESLPEILKILEANQVVVGSRYVPGGKVVNWNLIRQFISRLGNWYARLFTQVPIQDLTSGFVGYRAEILKKIPLSSFRSDGYGFQIEMKTQLYAAGAKMREFPIVFTERREGASKFSFGIVIEGFLYPIKIWIKNLLFKKFFNRFFYPAAIFFSSLLTYVLTAPRSIYLADNSEYITAAATLGIPHPSGYPLYILLAKLFSFLPFSTLPFRVNIFSALCGSLGLVLFYYIMIRVFRLYSEANPEFDFGTETRKSLAAAVGLLAGFAPIYWYESITAQVYTLHGLIFLLLLLLVLKFWEERNSQYLLWGAFLSGLGLTNHQMLALLLPFFLAAVVASGWQIKRSEKLVAALLFGLGLSVYLYLPIRTQMQPLYQWSIAGSPWQVLTSHVFRADYADFGLAGWPDKLRYVYDFLTNAYQQYGMLLPWALFGLFGLGRSEKRLFFLSLGLVAGNAAGIILLRNSIYSEVGGLIFSKYYLTSYLILAMWIGIGVVEMFRIFCAYFKKLSSVPYIMPVMVVLAVAAVYPAILAQNNLRDFKFLQNYSKQLLESLSPNSVLAVSLDGAATDSITFALLYQHTLRHVRPDVQIVGLPQVFYNPDFDTLNKIMRTGNIADQRRALVVYALSRPEFSTRPIYTTFPVETLFTDHSLVSYSNGLVYLLQAGERSLEDVPNQTVELSANDKNLLEQNAYGADLLAQYYYAQAAQMIQSGDFKGSQDYYVRAIQVEDNPLGFDIFAYRAHRDVFLK